MRRVQATARMRKSLRWRYTTADIDLVVEGGSRRELDQALGEFGLEPRGRHWVRGDLFVEVPGHRMMDPVDVLSVGPLTLRVVKREVVLADRIVGFKHWRATAYGAQAIAMAKVFGDALDRSMLEARLRAEDSMDAWEGLQRMADLGGVVDEAALDELLLQLGAPDVAEGSEEDG